MENFAGVKISDIFNFFLLPRTLQATIVRGRAKGCNVQPISCINCVVCLKPGVREFYEVIPLPGMGGKAGRNAGIPGRHQEQ